MEFTFFLLCLLPISSTTSSTAWPKIVALLPYTRDGDWNENHSLHVYWKWHWHTNDSVYASFFPSFNANSLLPFLLLQRKIHQHTSKRVCYNNNSFHDKASTKIRVRIRFPRIQLAQIRNTCTSLSSRSWKSIAPMYVHACIQREKENEQLSCACVRAFGKAKWKATNDEKEFLCNFYYSFQNRFSVNL